ncbi:MAG TPA: carboxypeptidase-like regulatory domain-containing protein [Pyrinomonadaceae bacterium]|jgi:hypothetical protein
MSRNIWVGSLAAILSLILCLAALAQATQRASFPITGRVLDAAGSAVAGVNVYAFPVEPMVGRLPAATSDKDGGFSIAVERTGRYILATSKLTDGYPSSYSSFYNPSGASLTEVLVEEDKAPTPVNIQLGPKAGKLVVHIQDAETQRAPQQMQVSICRVEAPMHCERHSPPETVGLYRALVPAVRLTIHVSAAGYRDWFSNEELGAPLMVDANETRELNISLQRAAEGDGNQSLAALEAPRQLLPLDGVELYEYPRVTRLEWTPVAGAVSYSVEVDFCRAVPATVKECQQPIPFQGRNNPPPTGIKTTSYEFSFIGAQPGRWRVWAVDAEGRGGAKSPWSTFFYKR